MTLTENYITIAEAAERANRSRPVVRRWIREGWIPSGKVLVFPGHNGAQVIDRDAFNHLLPSLLAEMASRKGGRGNKATDARGNFRGA